MMIETTPVLVVSLFIVGIAALLVMASAMRVPTSIMLFIGGLGAGVLLGSPKGVVDPTLLIGIVLPPLLYAATVTTSIDLVRRVALPGLAVGILLTIAIALVVSWVCLELMPNLGWAGAALLGLIAAASSSELTTELGLSERVPRRVAETLKGQGLVAPVLTLPAFQLIGAQLGGAPPSVEMIAESIARDWLAGGALGVFLGYAISRLRSAIKTEQIEIAVSIATPFLIAAIAELSSIVVIVPLIAAALVISALSVDRRGGSVSSAKTHILGRNFWGEALVLLAGAQYLLSGLALPGVFANLGGISFTITLGLAAAILVTVTAVELVGGMLAAMAMRSTSADPARWREGLWIGLLPGRSSIALLVVLIIPGTQPDGNAFLPRDIVLLITVNLVVGSALIKWAILPFALRHFGALAFVEHIQEVLLADAAVAGVDGRDAVAVAAARTRLLDMRRRGDIGDKTSLDANDRLDAAVSGRAALKSRTDS